jgi:FdhD protein
VRLPPPVGRGLRLSHGALQRALGALPSEQPLQAATGAVHCAAWCGADGRLREVREDVGRHNALDKLIGCLARDGRDAAEGFFLVSSRASYEMVLKTAAAGVELLAAVSAPTTLAVELAQRCGLTLVGFARPGRHNVYTEVERLSEEVGGA